MTSNRSTDWNSTAAKSKTAGDNSFEIQFTKLVDKLLDTNSVPLKMDLMIDLKSVFLLQSIFKAYERASENKNEGCTRKEGKWPLMAGYNYQKE